MERRSVRTAGGRFGMGVMRRGFVGAGAALAATCGHAGCVKAYALDGSGEEFFFQPYLLVN